MRFKKHQLVKTAKGKFTCICVDSDTAVFAPRRGSKTFFKDLFAVTSKYEKTETGGDANGFKFESA